MAIQKHGQGGGTLEINIPKKGGTPMERQPTVIEQIHQANNPPKVEVGQTAPQPTAVAQPTPTKPKTTQGSDAEAIRLDSIPSDWRPYEFKELHIRPMRGKHQSRFNTAAKMRDSQMLIDTVSSLFVEDVDAGVLTPEDFRWLLYWLRTNNYASLQLQAHVRCDNPDHVRDVQEGKMKAATLTTIVSMNRSTLEERGLDWEAVEAFLEATPVLADLELGFMTMNDTIEVMRERELLNTDQPDKAEAERREMERIDFINRAELACYFRSRDEQGKLRGLHERIAIYDEMDIDKAHALNHYRAAVSGYGVEETVKAICNGCGAEITGRFRVSAQMFL